MNLVWAAAASVAILSIGVGAHSTYTSADADELASITVNGDGSVATDPTFDGPQVIAVRVLEEGPYLEIEWDRYVDEIAAVDPAHLELRRDSAGVRLVSPSQTGPTDSIFFDRENRRAARSLTGAMMRLPAGMHMASIALVDDVNPSGMLSLEIDGSAIEDAAGRPARDITLVDVPQVSFYSQELPTASGVRIKASSRVDPDAMAIAAAQVDVQLSGPDGRIAAQMTERGCTLAIFGAREIAQLIPEHRRAFDPNSYEVEGYGGTVWNGCVSSVSERNVLRTRGSDEPALNTGYPNENILVHEFGHAVRLVGVDTLPDQSLSKMLREAYEDARAAGRWPNTYAISNVDEYFATLSAIWFDGMAESPTWDDGVRGPINTRAELRVYDPPAFEFLSRIYPAAVMPAPWNVSAPDDYHDGLMLPNEPLSKVEVVTRSRCVASRAIVIVTIHNRASQPVRARIESPFGTYDVASVRPGHAISRIVTSRKSAISDGVTAVSLTLESDGWLRGDRRMVHYDSVTC